MTILTVIPARGGSKGIPRKNIYPLNGKPLLLYTIEALQACENKMFILVSTDSNEITNIAKRNGVYTIRRPDLFSTDTASTESVLIHALNYMRENENREFEYVITAQPTTPFRKSVTIDSFINEFRKRKDIYNAQLTLHADHSDFWIKKDINAFVRLYPHAPRRRQERNPLYVENSCLYITESKILRETESVLGTKCTGFIIDNYEALDINEMEDMEKAEYLLKHDKIILNE
jgi:CMP-N-acetylneuraminic acid synthetase